MPVLNGHDVPLTTIRDVLSDRRSLGEKVFAVVDGEAMTFAEADDRANRIGNSLLGLGVSKGDVVMTFMHNSIDHIGAWFGCAKIGAIWAPINIALVNLDLLATIKNANPKVLIMDAELASNYMSIREQTGMPALIEIVRGDHASEPVMRPFAWLLDGSPDEPVVEIRGEDPAAIIYTGGSTGMPKGVVVSNLWYIAPALRYKEMFDVRPDDSHMGVGHLCHAIGSGIDVFCPLYWGIRTAISRWFSASQFWQTVKTHEPTIVGCIVGPLVAILCSAPPRPDDADNTLRIASTATGQIPHDKVAEFEERFGVEVLELYGQTESGPLGAIAQRSDDRPYYSQGKPHGWCDVMIADAADQPCPPNAEGEILLRPTIPHTFLATYYNQPDKFAEACRNLWFHTGDIGCLDANGYLHFRGRFAHSIRRRGENISALEVEHTILLHADVEECAVVGVPAQLGEEDVKAYVQLKPNAVLDPEELVRFCEGRIAYFKVPRYIEFVDEFPRSSAKKEIERHKLRERGISDAWDREAAGIVLQRPA